MFPKEMSNRQGLKANPTQSYSMKKERREDNIPMDIETMPDRHAHKQNKLIHYFKMS